MTPEKAIAEAAAGKLRPVYLVLGDERLLADEVLAAIRSAANKGGIAGFNEDKYTAGEVSVGTLLGAARMAPMMAKRRYVVGRNLERWEKKSDDEAVETEAPGSASLSTTKKGKVEQSPLDELAEYAKDPSPTTVLCLVATNSTVSVASLRLQRRTASSSPAIPLPRMRFPASSRRPPAGEETPSRPPSPISSLNLPETTSRILTPRSSSSRCMWVPRTPSPRRP